MNSACHLLDRIIFLLTGHPGCQGIILMFITLLIVVKELEMSRKKQEAREA
jgi:hypothetical protein